MAEIKKLTDLCELEMLHLQVNTQHSREQVHQVLKHCEDPRVLLTTEATCLAAVLYWIHFRYTSIVGEIARVGENFMPRPKPP